MINFINNIELNLFTYFFSVILLIPLHSPANSPPLNQITDHPEQDSTELDLKIGRMLMVGFRGYSIDESEHIRRDLNEYHLGGVVLFDYDVPRGIPERNVESPQQLKGLVSQLQETANNPLLIAIDQEGGSVARLKPDRGFPMTVPAQHLGEQHHADTTQSYSRKIARTLSELGINVNLAPVVDLNLNPENPIIGKIGRSFSDDPEVVARHAEIFIESHRQYGVMTALKHFPGHGSSKEDSHLGMVDVTELWQEVEVEPYRDLIESGHADMIMTAHIFNELWDTEYPATLSSAVITEILRNELGFEGVVISDDMQMDAIRDHYGLETAIKQAILAGVDILIFANNSIYDPDIVPTAHQIIRRLIDQGEISEERIDESYRRIQNLHYSPR